MKSKKMKFEGQLSGQKAKETYFATLLKTNGIKLPKVGEIAEVKLKNDNLNGAFLSILDGAKSLTVNGAGVAKTKVYNGEVALPKLFTLTFSINRLSDTATKLSANLQS